jgi:uncharacterized protein (UPF0261 family)
MAIYLLVTLDTKGPEAEFVRDRLRARGREVIVVDTGCIGQPAFDAEISRGDVFAAAGVSLAAMVERNDRGEAVTQAVAGVESIVRDAHQRGEVCGVIALGGSAGTTIGAAAMRQLPIGVPKVMVSTLASGEVRQWVGDKDIMMLNSVVDIAGVNRISRKILAQAADAIWGMTEEPETDSHDDRPLVAATMFGVTTQCVLRAQSVLEKAGYEVLVFHATGNGGLAMESLIHDGLISGVLDITTTELADELVGGVLSAGPHRLTAAGELGVPQVISVGATDMVNFREPDSVPDEFQNRLFRHNPTVTLMRTTADENQKLGAEIAAKAAAASGPTAVLLPLQGVSAIDCAGQPFDDPAARTALFESIRSGNSIEVEEHDCHINDESFADAAAAKLLSMMKMKGN